MGPEAVGREVGHGDEEEGGSAALWRGAHGEWEGGEARWGTWRRNGQRGEGAFRHTACTLRRN